MGQTFTDQFNCCTNGGQEEFEIKNLTSHASHASQRGYKGESGKSSAVREQRNTARELGDVPAVAGASDMTKHSSSAMMSLQNKKVLQFRLFKSLKDAGEISSLYTVGDVLGKGSFGEVRKCTNVKTGTVCAIKIVSKAHIGQHQVLVDLMEQELDVLQKTDHPHMVRVFELLQDNANFYIVTELVTGGELYDHIIKVKRLSEREAADVIKQLLLALNYMHEQNIVHRDIKPENILLAPEESSDGKLNLKLTDFGFACYYRPERGLRQVLGSPLYMAPEIVKEESYDKSVDIWSVGVIAHILLSGCPPFYGKTKQDIYRSIVSDIPKFGKVKNSLSPEAIQFVQKCLAKDPSRRSSALQLLNHPWLQDCEAIEVDEDVASEIIQDMAAFRKQNVFQTGVVSLLTALKVQSSELVNMKKMFLRLDSSQDGFLTYEELQDGMSQVLGVMRAGTQDWVDLIAQLDTNDDNKIDYGEFITAAVNRTRLLNEENLAIAFAMFDKDGNGQISVEELRAVFQGGLCQTALESDDDDETLWDQIMQEVDRNNDQVISSAEFNAAMMEVISHRSSNLR